MTSKPLIAFFFIFSANLAFADQPPCWYKFEVQSQNQKFKAVVDRNPEDSLKQPWLANWTLTVYQTAGSTKKPVWTTSYSYSGYPDGELSDDGEYFVYLEYWFYEDIPQIKIYSKKGRIKSSTLTGASFKIPSNKLIETVSHRLWLSDSNKSGFRKAFNRKLIYVVATIDDKKHYIDLEKGIFTTGK